MSELVQPSKTFRAQGSGNKNITKNTLKSTKIKTRTALPILKTDSHVPRKQNNQLGKKIPDKLKKKHKTEVKSRAIRNTASQLKENENWK